MAQEYAGEEWLAIDRLGCYDLCHTESDALRFSQYAAAFHAPDACRMGLAWLGVPLELDADVSGVFADALEDCRPAEFPTPAHAKLWLDLEAEMRHNFDTRRAGTWEAVRLTDDELEVLAGYQLARMLELAPKPEERVHDERRQ